jgi:hypothetical protein
MRLRFASIMKQLLQMTGFDARARVQLQQVAPRYQPVEADSAELDAPRGCFKLE